MQKKIYLSGKISGDPNFKEKFAKKEKELTELGHLVFNPALHPDMFTWEQFMELDLKALANCDSIYLLNDWQTSRGANIEYEEAVKLGKEIIFEEPSVKKEVNEPFKSLQEDYLQGKMSGSDILKKIVSLAFDNITLDESALSDITASLIQMVINENDFNKSDRQFLLSYEENRKKENLPVQLKEYKSWKFRLKLNDDSITPWQYYDHEPKSEDYIEVKKYYENLKKKEFLKSYEDKGLKISASEPSRTKIGYKVFYLKDGKLYPPMVKNPGGCDTPMNVWLDASAGDISSYSKTGRPQIEKGGPGTHCSKGELAYRPGWHLGEVPVAKQFEKVNPENGKKELFPREFVWAECEYSCDVDYQNEAMKNGYTDNGSFRHSYAGLQKVPENGCYRYRTNPDPNTEEWIITGKIKVKRILSGKEVDEICRKAGKEPQKREKTFEELEELLKKKLSRDVSDYIPARNKEEADLFKLKRESDMAKRLEHELDKNKVFHDKEFLSYMRHKYKNIYGMAAHFAEVVKDNPVRAKEIER